MSLSQDAAATTGSGAKVIFCAECSDTLFRVYGQDCLPKAEKYLGAKPFPQVLSKQDLRENADKLKEVEAIFSTWTMPTLGEDELQYLPNLKGIFYAAGSVKGFASPLLERGIFVVSSWMMNAIPVAEFTLGQILLGNKGFFRNNRELHARLKTPHFGPGNYRQSVALLGVGQIGRRVIDLLRPFQMDVAVFDPYLPAAQAESLQVRSVSLEDAFAHGHCVSNHLANVPETKEMIRGKHFELMRPDAVFINTGRGATVHQAEMIEVLKKRPDLSVLLDVWTEDDSSSELFELSNVFLSSHIAGSANGELARMAEFVFEQYRAWQRGEPKQGEVSLEMLPTMA